MPAPFDAPRVHVCTVTDELVGALEMYLDPPARPAVPAVRFQRTGIG